MNTDECLKADELRGKMPSQEVNDITQMILGCAYTVSNTLGIGYVEKVYENALVIATRRKGLLVEQQFPIKVFFDGVVVGDFFADLYVEQRVLVELKAVSMLKEEHTAQALNYLRAASAELCLLLNFGKPKVEIKRLLPSIYWRTPNP